MPVDVLCIGHAAFDYCMAVEAFPAENSKVETDQLLEGGGGPAANAAYLLASWGIRCGFAGLIGNDDYGCRVAQEFQEVGVDISLMEARPGCVTPVSFILANKKTGTRTVINRKINGPCLQPDETALKKMAPKVLLFDGHELPASLAALSAFPSAISILDAGSWREGTAQLAGRVHYLVASEKFACQATGSNGLVETRARLACMAQLRKKFSTSITVTLGEHGLIADNGGGLFHLPAFPAQAVDSTAAGDIFHGAFAYAALQGLPFKEGLRLASMAASLSVQKPGGRASIPPLGKVMEELAHA